MLEGDQNQEIRRIFLRGKTPEQFLEDQVAKEREARKDKGEQLSPRDIASLALLFVGGGYITEENVVNSVKNLGLTPEEEAEFIPKTLPETRALLEEEDKRQEEIAEQKRKEFLREYTEEWGLPRLDIISDYFKSQLPQAEVINPRWKNALEQYPKRRPQIEEMLERVDNPKTKTGILMRELYALSNIHPSEVTTIFEAEQRTKSYVYLDCLFETAVAMHANDTGKDPDFENIESGAITISYRQANNPEHMAWVRRKAAMEKLAFGAKFPNETYDEGKPRITPFMHAMDKQIEES